MTTPKGNHMNDDSTPITPLPAGFYIEDLRDDRSVTYHALAVGIFSWRSSSSPGTTRVLIANGDWLELGNGVTLHRAGS